MAAAGVKVSVKPEASEVEVEDQDIPLFVRTFEEAEKIIKRYELREVARFASWKSDNAFAKDNVDIKGHKILFEDIKRKDREQQIKYDGTPFIVLGEKIYCCQFSKDKNASTKKKQQLKRDEENSAAVFTKYRFHNQDTKKLGCPAQIVLRDVVRFPDYKAKDKTERHKRNAVNKLKEEWNDILVENMERRIYIKFPSKNTHSGHVMGEGSGISQKVDQRIISKIHSLVGEGVRSIKEMERHLKIYVSNELFKGEMKPPTTNRRFYPRKKDIRNHMHLATIKFRYSKVDQCNLVEKIDAWKKEKPDDNFFFRPYGESPDNVLPKMENASKEREDPNTSESEDDEVDEVKIKSNVGVKRLLFVYQTKSQQRILNRYGNQISLLDATYKTTKYALPLFFVVVKTNVDYQIVASFVVQDESTKSITEALAVLKSWNPLWDPKCFMVDNCEEEIQSIEALFPSCSVLLCDFHREQAWCRWLATTANGMRPFKEIALSLFRNIAKASTEEEYCEAVTNLKRSQLWNAPESKRLRDWFGKIWLPQYKRWVWAFRKSSMDIVVRTNNGVERQNKDFKHEYLRDYKDNSLSGMITVLVEHFLPDKYKLYVERNTKCSSFYRGYNPNLPTFLHDRPKIFVEHCKARLTSADAISTQNIQTLSDGLFSVRSHKGGKWYRVFFGSDTSEPSCECPDWESHQMPCKHFMAILQAEEINVFWQKFPAKYRNRPHFILDEKVLFDGKCTVPMQGTALIKGDNEDFDDDSTPAADMVNGNSESVTSFLKLPINKYKARSKAAACRDLLNQIRSLTFLVYDEDVLDSVHSELIRLLNKLESSAPQDNGLIKEETNKPIPSNQGQTKKTIPKNEERKFLKLPQRRKRTSKLTGRVGVGADNKRRAAFLDVMNTVLNDNHRVVIEESVDLEEMDWQQVMKSYEDASCPQGFVAQKKEVTSKNADIEERDLLPSDNDFVAMLIDDTTQTVDKESSSQDKESPSSQSCKNTNKSAKSDSKIEITGIYQATTSRKQRSLEQTNRSWNRPKSEKSSTKSISTSSEAESPQNLKTNQQETTSASISAKPSSTSTKPATELFSDKASLSAKSQPSNNYTKSTTPSDTSSAASKSNSKSSTLTKSRVFTPDVDSTTPMRETLLRNGPNNLSILTLKSLEPFLPEYVKELLCETDRPFRTGWLYDEIIDSFLWNLARQNDHILLCPSLITKSMSSKSSASIRGLWKNQDFSNVRYIFGPWNPSGSHWVLIVADLVQQEIIYLDPISNSCNSSDSKKAFQMFSWIVHCKLSVDYGLFKFSRLNHTLQDDAKSCGVIVCWYAEKLTKGESVASLMDCYGYRRIIYKAITGNCIKDLFNVVYLSDPSKKRCGHCQKSEEGPWTQCSRCDQWYHCKCLNISLQDAKKTPYLFCPA